MHDYGTRFRQKLLPAWVQTGATMNLRGIPAACYGIAAALTLAACATPPYDGPRSGFLPDSDYSKLKKQPAPGGGDRYVYVSDTFEPYNYGALIVEHLQFYPEPQPSDHVTLETLNQIRSYADLAVRTKLGQKVKLVDQAGPGVARLRLGITAVGEKQRPLKPYQYVPVALVITGGVALAQGGRPHDATIAFESELTNSVSKQPLLVVVRGGTGERVQSNEQDQHVVTLDDLKPLIDAWTDAAAVEVTNYIQGK